MRRKTDKGWLSRRDYPKLLEAIKARLAPGGILIACSNTLGGKKGLKLANVVEQAGFTIMADGPKLAVDLPQRKGFPEGKPFQLITATVQEGKG